MLGGTQDAAHVAAHEQMARLVATANLPRIREALPYFAECDVEAQFEFGLDLLIGGIQAKIAASA